MQKYTDIAASKTIADSRALLLDNDKTVMSNNSGTSFPTANLQPGMLCFRTDLKKFYYLAADGTTWVEIINVSAGSGKVKSAETADNATKVNSHTVNSDVPANAKFTDTTYAAATNSAAGLMTAAQKTKLDGVAANANNYSLPTASASTLGGVKIGDGLAINNGVVSTTVTGGNASHGSQLFTADGTFTAPEGVSILYVTAVGGGGGGSGMSYPSSNGTAGSRARCCECVLFVASGTSISVKIGIGGSGGTVSIGGSGGSGINAGSRGDDVKDFKGAGGGGGGATGINSVAIAAGGAGGYKGSAGGSGGSGGGSIYHYSPFISTTYGAAGSGSSSLSASGGMGTNGCVYIQW